MWMSPGEKSASEFYGSLILFFSLKIGPGTLVLSVFFLSLDPRWCILPLMGLQALPTLKWRAGPPSRVCGFNEEPWMQTRIKHALKIPRSQPVLPPPASPPPDPGAQGQQKVTCQTDTPGNLEKGTPRGPRSTLWTCFLSAKQLAKQVGVEGKWKGEEGPRDWAEWKGRWGAEAGSQTSGAEWGPENPSLVTSFYPQGQGLGMLMSFFNRKKSRRWWVAEKTWAPKSASMFPDLALG